MTHSYLMSGDDQPVCESCRLLLTVKHKQFNCPNLQDTWLKYFTVSRWKTYLNMSTIATSLILSN